MNRKRKLITLLATVGAFSGMVIAIATSSNFSNSNLNKVAEQSYSLTLDNSNAYSSGSSMSVSTDSGNYYVTFGYSSCSAFADGHATISNGGYIKNTDHILSITEFKAVFTGNLQIRTSYDGELWGEYFDVLSNTPILLTSKPYYIEMKANSEVKLTSAKYTYSCVANPDIPTGGFRKVNSLSELEAGKKVIIGGISSKDDTDFIGTNEAIYQTYYLTGIRGTVTSNYLDNVESLGYTIWTIGQESNGYTFHSETNYLTSNVNGTHYNASVSSGKDSTASVWTISSRTGGFDVKSGLNVYLKALLYTKDSKTTPEITGSSGTTTDFPINFFIEAAGVPSDPISFSISDIGTYRVNDAYDASHLEVSVQYSDGSSSKVTSGYTWVITNSSGHEIPKGTAFSETGNYTLTVTYGTFGSKSTTIVVNEASSEQSVEISTFTEISGDMDSHIAYAAEQGTAANPPIVSGSLIRIYQNGGYFYVEAKDTETITGVTFQSNMATTVQYETTVRSVPRYLPKTNITVAKDTDIVIDGLNARYVKVTCMGADKTSRLYLSYLKVTYSLQGGVETVPVSSVSVSPTSKTLSLNGTQQLTHTIEPSNATNKSVSWSSNNTSVATVDNSGLVTAKAVGSATITVTTQDGNKTATCAISVENSSVPVTGVTLSSNSETITVGNSVTLTATIKPSNATDKTVTWSSSDSSIASVSNGVVTGVTIGNATITVTTHDGNRTATCNVTVESGGGASETITIVDTDAPATYGTATQETVDDYTFAFTNVGNSYTSGYMQCKKSASNIYNITPINGLQSITINTGSKSWGGTVYYGTSEEPLTNSATESSGKYVIPSGNQYFNLVTNSLTGYIESIKIEYSITPINPSGISIPSTVSVGVGASTTLDVTYLPADCNTNKGVTWKSNNTSVVTVNDGVITGVSTGSTTVVATSTYNTSFKSTCNVTVTEQSKDKWTILLYICGADLESGSNGGNGGYATSDLNEIKSVSGQPDDVNVVIETGGAKSWKNTQGGCIDSSKLSRFHLSNRTFVSDEKITKANMGLTSTLQSFISWGMSEYPAEKTALILWNHGGGMRGVCYDENFSDDALYASEVASALQGAGCTGDNKLEWIGYDACLMGVQDIAEKNSPYANYMVASEESELGSGWDYDTWLDDVFSNKSTTTILKAIVDGFIQDQGGPNSNQGDQTLAYYDLSYAAAFKTAWESFASALSSKFGSGVSKSTFGSWMHNNVKYFGGENDDDEYFGVFDAKDFVNKIAANSSYNPGSSYTSAVLTALGNLVAYSVAQRGAGNAYGIACTYHYTTATNWKFNNCYGTSETNLTNWRSFVSSYGTL